MKIVISNYCFTKIMWWVNHTDNEISGPMKYTYKDGVFTVHDTILVPQVNSATASDIEPSDMAQAMFKLKDVEGELGHWHSHVNMGVFVSGTDIDTYKQWAGTDGYCLALIFNKKKEIKGIFYSARGKVLPWGVEPLYYDDVKVEIAEPAYNQEEAWKIEYDANVKKKEWPVSRPYQYGGQDYGYVGSYAGWEGRSGRGDSTYTGGGVVKEIGLTKKQRKRQIKIERANLERAYLDDLWERHAKGEVLNEIDTHMLMRDMDVVSNGNTDDSPLDLGAALDVDSEEGGDEQGVDEGTLGVTLPH